MTPMARMLLIGAASVVSGVVLGVSAIRKEQTHNRRLRERIMLVTEPYLRINRFAVMGRGMADASLPLARMIAAAGRLFGHDAARAGRHPPRWWISLTGALIAASTLAAVAEIFVGRWSFLVIPVAWIMISRFLANWGEQKRRDKLYAQFPDALAMIVRAVRVGVPLGEGIRTVAREAEAPTRGEFAQLYDRVAIGVTLEDAMREMAARNSLPEYRFFTTALSLQSQTGGGLSEALEGLAEVIRRRLALKARGNALAAEAKTSIIILAALPFVSGGALTVLNPAYMGRLINEHGCQKILLAAILLLVGGLLVMRGMIRKMLS